MNRLHIGALAVFTVTVVVLASSFLFAQGIGNTTGTIAGNATDESGVPISNVLVTIHGASGTSQTTTDGPGKFTFPFVLPGSYDLRAELQNFTTIEQSNLQVGLKQRIQISLKMKHSIQESVTVIDETPLVDRTG